MPLILPGNVASATASTTYTVANSCRFDRASSIKLERTPGSAGNRRTFTFSCWFKLGNSASSVSDYIQIFGGFDGAGNEGLFISDADQFYLYMENTNALISNLKLRDPSAWYHVVMAVDTTNGTADNRCRLYLNGSEITSFGTRSNPTQNYDSGVNNTSVQNIGERIDDDYFDGYMAEVVLIDGLQLTPTSFGEFDSDSPTIWKPIDVSGLTFGTNGFYLSFSDSADLGADSSGNSNDFTAVNLAAADQATDTPTNNFATLNPVDAHTTSPTFAEGNLDFHAPSGTAFTPSRATIAVSKGKWYVEFKATTASATLGACSTQSPMDDHMRDSSDVRSIYRLTGGYWYGQNNGGAIDDQGDNSETFTDDDICMCALDMDNGYFYFGINGTWVNGQDGSTTGDPAGNNGGSGGAGNPSSQLLTNQHDGVYTFFAMDGSTAGTGQLQANFGNPPYTISSGNADADGYGNFEYAPPSGFYALCTKNLAEYG